MSGVHLSRPHGVITRRSGSERTQLKQIIHHSGRMSHSQIPYRNATWRMVEKDICTCHPVALVATWRMIFINIIIIASLVTYSLIHLQYCIILTRDVAFEHNELYYT